MDVKLSTVVLSHINDSIFELGIGLFDNIRYRLGFVNYLIRNHKDTPLSEVQFTNEELNKLWIELFDDK